MEEQAKKPWYLSKTLIVNFLVGVLALAFPEKLGEILTEANALMFITVINMVLRMVTKDKLEIS